MACELGLCRLVGLGSGRPVARACGDADRGWAFICGHGWPCPFGATTGRQIVIGITASLTARIRGQDASTTAEGQFSATQRGRDGAAPGAERTPNRSEEHTSELQSRGLIS